MGDFDIFDTPQKPAATSGGDFADFDQPVTPEKRSFLGEAAHRAADFGRSVVENAKNVPTASWERVKANAATLGHPFAEAGREVADEVTHPLRTLQGAPLARALGYSTPEAVKHHDAANREEIRGLQGNIPLAGLAHERLTGFPEESKEDAAEAPHAHGAGFTLGTALGMAGAAAAPTLAPLLGRGLSTAANATQDALLSGAEASVARSAARRAVTANPVREAATDLAKDLRHHGIRHGIAAQLGHMVGGHTGALIGGALSVAKPAAKLIGTAADEGFAALSRRALPEAAAAPVAEAEAAGPLQSAAWDPEGWRSEAPATATAAPETAVAPAEAAPVVAPAEPEPIKLAREALKDPNIKPDQADALKKAIAGYQAKAARKAPAPETKAEAVAAEPTKPEPPSEARPEMWGGRPSNVERPAPPFTPSDADAKYAKGIGMTVPAYREMMIRTTQPGYREAVQKLARLAKESTSLDEFASQATAGGLSDADARRLFKVAHPNMAEATQ